MNKQRIGVGFASQISARLLCCHSHEPRHIGARLEPDDDKASSTARRLPLHFLVFPSCGRKIFIFLARTRHRKSNEKGGQGHVEGAKQTGWNCYDAGKFSLKMKNRFPLPRRRSWHSFWRHSWAESRKFEHPQACSYRKIVVDLFSCPFNVISCVYVWWIYRKPFRFS